jgi:fatty-acyl-CoA synthase
MNNSSRRFWPLHLPEHPAYPQTGFDMNLTAAAQRAPDRSFVNFYGHDTSYAQADAIVTAIAAYLQDDCNFARGDRAILYAQNCPQFMLAFQGILRAGGIVVPVNPMNMASELAHVAGDSGAQVAFVAEELLDKVAAAGIAFRRVIVIRYADFAPQTPSVAAPALVTAPPRENLPETAVRWSDALATPRAFAPLALGPDDPAVLAYSSGTTGAPKGCLHTHGSVTATAVSSALWDGLGADSTFLCVSPLFHVTGIQFGMNRCIYSGAGIVLMQRWDAGVAAELVERHRVTHWNGVPLLVAELLSNPQAAARDLSSIRTFSGGGAAMPAAVAQEMKDRFGVDFVEGYGLTEAMGPSHFNPPQRAKKQCLGIPSFDVEAMVVDPATMAEPPQGEVGEILLRGPGLFRGYWNNEEATRAAFVEIDGRTWFRTGDLARIDADGYFFFADRLKRMINAAGYKIWPAEVESMMFAHPAIQECCIIAAPDARRGESVKAVVALRPGVAPSETLAQEIIAWCRAKMSSYKVPREIAFVGALPRSGAGKIDWRRLQEAEFASGA